MKHFSPFKSARKAFTLIELLVVIAITAMVSGNVLMLSWPSDHTGWRLQVQTNSLSTGLNTNWVDVSGSITVNGEIITMDSASGTVFYRMIFP